MEKLVITGGTPLKGEVTISGAKNAAVAILPATLLINGICTINNLPNISDVKIYCEILEALGAKIKWTSENEITIDTTNIITTEAPLELTSKFRASYYLLGSLLGRKGSATVGMPGGCKLGARPIDQHTKGFEFLGANVKNNGNKYIVEAEELKGSNIYLDIASVGATINIMLAAVKAKGITIIDNAAKEPEIVNIATFLNNMGAKIRGAGTSTIKIEGVEYLHKCFHEVIPDRIEAGTYIIIGALCGKDLKIDNIIPEHVDSLLSKLEEIGVKLEIGSDYVIVSKRDTYKSTNIKTLVYPGFPTDLQQPFTTLLTQCNGKSKVTETIWENRFMHIPYLSEMGADITVKNQTATIIGPTKLKGSEVVATDLRAGAAMVAAALIATGKTRISNVEHILRGYENIVEKLTNVGAKIKIEEIQY